MIYQTFKSTRPQQRTGAAAVEFAVIAPLFFLLILGIVEFGRAMMVLQHLNSSARSGARVAVLSGASHNQVTQVVNDNLAPAGITGASTTIRINGQAGNVGSAASGDAVSVTVSVPYQNVTWLPTTLFISDVNLSSTTVMRRE